MGNWMRQRRTEADTCVIPTLSSSLRNRENIAVGRTTDVVDNVDAAGEPDLAIWSLDKWFEELRFVETVLDRIAGGTSLRSP
jgi:hypothetical protein